MFNNIDTSDDTDFSLMARMLGVKKDEIMERKEKNDLDLPGQCDVWTTGRFTFSCRSYKFLRT